MQTRKQLTDKFLDLKDQKSILEDRLDEIKENMRIAEQDLILSMEEEGLQSFRDEQRGLVYLRQDIFASVEDPSILFPYLRGNGNGDMIKETVNAKTLASFAKDNPALPGAKISYVTKLGVRK